MRLDSLDKLKALGNKPRVHGNGFVQLDLTGDERLNIWGHPNIPKQKVSTQIHNHRFTFTSKVLVGDLVHTTYSLHKISYGEADDPYDIYQAINKKREDTKLVSTDRQTYIYEHSTEILLVGDSYRLNAGTYHSLEATEPSATIMKKHETFQIVPSVLVPANEKPDNDFDRHSFDEDELWQIISEVLRIR